MSGPKSYSVEVFDKNLKTLFVLQNEIVNLWQMLNALKISDSSRKIEISCAEFLEKHVNQFQNLNKPFIQNFEGDINQEQFNKFYNRIHTFIEKQQKLKLLLEVQQQRFNALEDDYKYYIETEKLIKNYQEDFAVLKNQMLEYIDNSNLDDKLKNEKIANIKKVNFNFEHPPFTAETAKNLGVYRKALTEYFEGTTKKLGVLSASGSQIQSKNNVEEKVKLVSSQNFKNARQSRSEVAASIGKIETLLDGLKEGKHKQAFTERLLNLKHDLITSNKYFLVELHEEIKKHIQQQDIKGNLLRIHRALSATTFVSSLDGEIKKFKTRIDEALNHRAAKQQDVVNITSRFESLVEKNKVLIKQNQIAAQERKYIKSRLVAALHDLNYDVVGDANVVNLESPDALLIKVSDHQNFINLRFDDKGQLLYNYLIPEDRNNLSFDEQALKMVGMEETCNEFKKMLGDLQQQGLNVELKNEIPITEKALIRLPEKYRGLIKQDKKKSAASAKVNSRKRKMGR